MRVIALKDSGTEIFDGNDKITEDDQTWIEIDGDGNIKGDVFIVFRQ